MFGLLIGVTLFLLVFMIIYLIKCLGMLKIVNKIKNKYLRLLVKVCPFIILYLIFGFINAVVIVIHLFIFVVFSQFILFLYKKVSNKKINDYLFLLCGLVITTIYLSIAAYLDYHVYETKYEVETTKEIGTNKFRIIQISDAHVGTTFDGKGFEKHIDKISKIDADLIVITGDFVDDNTSKKDMKDACAALSKLKSKYGTYFVYGNHDEGYFSREYNPRDLAFELEQNNVTILRDEVVELNDYIYLIGRQDARYKRKDISELVSNLDTNKYMIDLNHQPNDYDNESKSNIDLVLSGHSHGGQLFPLGYVGLISGANDSFKGLTKRDNTTFIVNTGISNWELIFKTGTSSEYTIIDIVKKGD